MKMLHTILLFVVLESVNAIKLGAMFTALLTAPGKCLRPYGQTDGAKIVIYDCANSLYVWTWAEVAEQPVEIESVSIKSCITAVNESNVELWGCDPSRNQKWKVNLDGTIGLVSDPSKCLDLTGSLTENGSPVGIAGCKPPGEDQRNQLWWPSSWIA